MFYTKLGGTQHTLMLLRNKIARDVMQLDITLNTPGGIHLEADMHMGDIIVVISYVYMSQMSIPSRQS